MEHSRKCNYASRIYKKCVICNKRRVPGSNVRLAKLPLDPDRCRQWVKAIGQEDLVYLPIEKLHELKFVCFDHFREEHINKLRTRLLIHAVPTINLPIPLEDELLVNFPVYFGQHPTYVSTTSVLEPSQHLTSQVNAETYAEEDPLAYNQEEYNQEEWKMLPILIVHGGAGDIPQSRVQGKLDGTLAAVRAGYNCLMNGGSALKAVEAAVISMENDANFNAGYGSVLNLRGEVEMEASIMRGSDLNVGAVTLVKEFSNPISIAHRVLTDSPHSLLGGEGAKLFALEKGFEPVPPESLITEHAKEALENFLKFGDHGRTEIGSADEGFEPVPPESLITKHAKEALENFLKFGDHDRTEIGSDDEGSVGTVGAVAVDAYGHIAVATSTGGMSGKAVGRIGDTPQIGSGTYADDNIGGVSTTGHGESILKYCLAHSIIKLIESGLDAETATKKAVDGMTARLNNTAGAITLSKDGDVGIHFTSKRMSWGYVKDSKIYYGIDQGQIFVEDL